jgi:hypothetical protein
LIELVSEVLRLRSLLQGVELPAGMRDAIVAGAMLRPSALPVLQAHYCRSMPARLFEQQKSELFRAPLELARMPRLAEALHALFALTESLPGLFGAATPAELVRGRTLGELYTQCHFGRSMPMLYAHEALTADSIDARLTGPLIHELSHFRTGSPPAPANLHEALAAWIGSEAWPAQIDGPLDALPGCACFAAVGGWLVRTYGLQAMLEVQAGLLDLRDLLGARCSEALRVYGFLPFLETGAPHLLSDAFHPQRWWKLLDLHRDPGLSDELLRRFVEPALQGSPPPQAAWDAWLDQLSWRDLPAFGEPACEADHQLARRAERALRVRTERSGMTFRVRRVETSLRLDREQCLLRSSFDGPDALGAPPVMPYPPSLCRE